MLLFSLCHVFYRNTIVIETTCLQLKCTGENFKGTVENYIINVNFIIELVFLCKMIKRRDLPQGCMYGHAILPTSGRR